MAIRGWLVDCYPSRTGEGLVFWIKTKSGETLRLRDSQWKARIYAAGAACDDPQFVFSKVKESGWVASVKFARKKASIFDKHRSRVLEIELRRSDRVKKVAEQLESAFQNPVTFKLYDVDVIPEQQYFFQKKLFPLADVSISVRGDQITRWRLHDSVEATDYARPPLKFLKLDIDIGTRVPRLDSKLLGISLTSDNGSGFSVCLDGSGESEILLKTASEIERFDPDILITTDGDTFTLPYLYSKASLHSIDLKLNRDPEFRGFTPSIQTGGKTYFSYGRILYKPSTQRLYGRIHIDEQNTYIYDQCKFEGLYEISRLSRMPLHVAARASIGKCLSGIQFYYAHSRDTLVPYKPVISEEMKSMDDLLVADRGGLVFVPLAGIHENVCEIDFASLYPSIIRDRNISAETVNCTCCPDSDNRIEELNMHICKHQGIVPQSLQLPIRKRFAYKELRNLAGTNIEARQIYSERAAALKWILVTSFGYLSFRHAKFMKIDAHIAVCSVARQTLLDAMHRAENRGFQMIHGIVDSLWLHKERARLEDYRELCSEIEGLTGFKLAIEGIYKWIVFLPSKVDSRNQVANRYFGCFKDGNEIKTRGIEQRRHDTPPFFKKCQSEILQDLSICDNEEELRQRASTKGMQIFNDYAKQIEEHNVPAQELLITRRLSKDLDDYFSRRQLSVSAARKLEREGLKLKAGQSVSYVITKYKSTGSNRAVPEELVDSVDYDTQRYVELLADSCTTILSPLGVSKEILLSRSRSLTSWK